MAKGFVGLRTKMHAYKAVGREKGRAKDVEECVLGMEINL
jgi:hypothetical protein